MQLQIFGNVVWKGFNKCVLSIALLIFYRADGTSYLLDKSCNGILP